MLVECSQSESLRYGMRPGAHSEKKTFVLFTSGEARGGGRRV